MQELKVKNVIIGKQFDICDNYEEFKRIVKEKKIKVRVVEAGQKLTIENDLYFTVLWPSSKCEITDNTLNNNSLVCKLVYKEFSMLFTGDIEEIAEKELLKVNKKNVNMFKSTILKVAHHGSKTSSTKEFLKAVQPQIVLIGVGANNNFGHPSKATLKNLEEMNCEVYRTDEDGEITIRINNKERIWINRMINQENKD